MAELSLNVNSRKFIRKSVTETHNKKSNFVNLSLSERLNVKATLSDYLVSLKELNNKIQSLKFSDSVPESE